jgi:hypothetical protein
VPENEHIPESKLIVREIDDWLAGRRKKAGGRDACLMREHINSLLMACLPPRPLSPKQRVRHLVCSFWAIIVARDYLRYGQG